MRRSLALCAMATWLMSPALVLAQQVPQVLGPDAAGVVRIHNSPQIATPGQGCPTWDQYGRTTGPGSGCGGTTTPAAWGCTNSPGQITCTQSCTGFPTLSCLGTAAAQPLTLASQPAVGDILVVSIATQNGSNCATVGGGSGAMNPGWVQLDFQSTGFVNYTCYAAHVVQAGESSVYTPFTGQNTSISVYTLTDITALGAGNGSISTIYVSDAVQLSGTIPGSTTVSGSTPAGSTVALAIGTAECASGGSALTSSALTGITTAQSSVYTASNCGAATAVSWSAASGSMSATYAVGTSAGGAARGVVATMLFFKPVAAPGVPLLTPSSGSATLTAYAGPNATTFILSGAGSATSLVESNLPATTNAWVNCYFQDQTSPTVTGYQSGFSTTGFTITLNTSPGATDKITLGCNGRN